MPELVSAFLKWKYPSADRTQDTPPADAPTPTESDEDQSDEDLVDEDLSFTLQLVDIYSLGQEVNVNRMAAVSVAGALVSQGFLGNTPLNPSVAISLKTLELYRRLRLRKASFSVEAFTKVICDFYAVSTVLLNVASSN